MSTIDPAVERVEREESRRGSPRVAASVLLLVLIGLTGAVVTGLGFGSIVGELRDSAINSIFAETGTNVPPWAPVLLTAMLLMGALPVAVTKMETYSGRRSSGWWVLGAGLAFFAAGVALSTLWWSEPLQVGVAVDPVFHTDETWSGWGWSVYYSDVWLPILLLALAALVTLGLYRDQLRTLAQDAELDRLLREGTRTIGTVTEVAVHYASSEGASRVAGATATVRYLDGHRQQRFVVRRSPRAEVVAMGLEAQVVYDPHTPEREAAIFVSFVERPILKDWIGGKWPRRSRTPR